jgi:adenosine/AMP kinase
MDLKIVAMEIPEDSNIIVGHSHFIKTVEDLYEVLAGGVPQAKFGLAFCEASGPCLVRSEGNDESMKQAAITNAMRLGAGHSFVIVLKNAYPINVLNAIKNCQEVCTIHCATANPVQIILAESEQGRGVLGVIDGEAPKGVESGSDRNDRQLLLRKFGYKR